MLDTTLEFRKGILFVRLVGKLDHCTSKQLQSDVTDKVIQNGIQKVVFNLEQLEDIDMKGINLLLYNYEICRERNGNCYICNIPNEKIYRKLKKYRTFNYLLKRDNELSILHEIARLEETV